MTDLAFHPVWPVKRAEMSTHFDKYIWLVTKKIRSLLLKIEKNYFVRSGNFPFMHLCISLYALQTYVLDLFSSVLDLEWPRENAMYSQLSV